MTETKQITMADVQPVHEGDKIAQVTVHEVVEKPFNDESSKLFIDKISTKHVHSMNLEEVIQMRDDLNEIIGEDEWIDIDDKTPAVNELVWICRISKDIDDDLLMNPGDTCVALKRFFSGKGLAWEVDGWAPAIEPRTPSHSMNEELTKLIPVKPGDMWKSLSAPKPPKPKLTQVEKLEARVKELEEENARLKSEWR